MPMCQDPLASLLFRQTIARRIRESTARYGQRQRVDQRRINECEYHCVALTPVCEDRPAIAVINIAVHDLIRWPDEHRLAMAEARGDDFFTTRPKNLACSPVAQSRLGATGGPRSRTRIAGIVSARGAFQTAGNKAGI